MGEPLQVIGYWRNEQHPDYPDPRALVDPTWDRDDRRAVVDYLRGGTAYVAAAGLSPCRFCGKSNGSAELTDGALAWPEGLAHYLEEHDVRLPARVEEYLVQAARAARR
jgi:hypothetical protein